MPLPVPANDLTGTLSGMDVLGLLQAFQQQQGTELQGRTAAATQQAQSAQQAYGSAAAQPPPQLTPGDTFLPGLLGSISSILSGNPTYQQQAEKSATQKQADLLKARADNLQALRDVYSQKAEEAQKAGDLETTEKYRTKLETLSKTYDLVNSNADRAAKAHQAELDRQNALQVAQIRANKSAADTQAEQVAFFDNEVKQNGSGNNYLPLTNVPAKFKLDAIKYAKDHGIPAVSQKDDDRLGRLDIARQNTKDMLASMETFLPKDALARLTVGPLNHVADITKSNPEIVNYHTYFEALVEQLVALAGGAGSGVRINKSEIERLVKIAPQIDTPLPVAQKWAERVNSLIDNTERPILGRAIRPATQPAGKKIKVVDPQGKSWEIDQADLKDSIAHGWKRAS